MSRRVLIDVDVQHDFCEQDGALFVAGSPNDLFRAIVRRALEAGTPILGSVDSHAYDAWEFASNGNLGPDGAKPNFPDHCVKGTRGWLKVAGTLPPRARFVPNVANVPPSPLVAELASGATQGLYFEKEVYSLFANPSAEPIVSALADALGGEPTFVVFGVATDYCVRAAALGLRERGHTVTVVSDAIRGITPAGVDAALSALTARGCALATASELGLVPA